MRAASPSLVSEPQPSAVPAAAVSGNSVCSRCAAAFDCGVVAGGGTCWCMAMPRLLRVGPGTGACMCPACLERALKEQTDAGISHSPGR